MLFSYVASLLLASVSMASSAVIAARFTCPSLNGRFADPDDCKRYYDCGNGDAYLKDCEADLQYNSLLQECIYSEVSECEIKEEDLDANFERQGARLGQKHIRSNLAGTRH